MKGVLFAPLEFAPKSTKVNKEICDSLSAAGIPIILLDRDIAPYPERSGFDLVGIDNHLAGYLATDHLLSRNCREAAFLTIAEAAPTVHARMAGWREAHAAHAVSPGHLLIAVSDEPDAVERAWKDARANAFVCANDRVAALLMRTVIEAGQRPPRTYESSGSTMRDRENAADSTYDSASALPRDRADRNLGVDPAHQLARMPAREILLPCRLVVRRSS